MPEGVKRGVGEYTTQRQVKIGSAELMCRRLKPYPAYRDSGVEWLGEIPAHWEANRLKYAVTLNPSAAEVRNRIGSLEVSFVPMEAIGEYGGLELTATKPLADVYSGYTYFREGDIVVAKITPCFENGKGALAQGLVNRIAFGTTELHVLRVVESTDPRFLFYASMGDVFRQLGEAEMYGAGGQKRVPDSFVENLRHPLPPPSEQRAIAAFLDRETAKIDALVVKKERLIELLQEKRATLITQAVTKGLDPDVRMKDSGVERLGKIPTHWKAMKVTRLFEIGSGTTPPTDYADYYGGDVPWVTTSELRESVVSSTEKTVTRHALRTFPTLNIYPEGSVVVAMYGATIGRIGLLGKAAAVNQACCVFTKPNGIDFSFWFYWLQSRRSYLISLGYGGGQPNLSQDLLKTIRVPIPSLDEQRAIAAFLDHETSKIAALLVKSHEAVGRLKELRTAIISAAVTGKIDVRENANLTAGTAP